MQKIATKVHTFTSGPDTIKNHYHDSYYPIYRRFSATEYYVKEASYKKIYSITLYKK